MMVMNVHDDDDGCDDCDAYDHNDGDEDYDIAGDGDCQFVEQY